MDQINCRHWLENSVVISDLDHLSPPLGPYIYCLNLMLLGPPVDIPWTIQLTVVIVRWLNDNTHYISVQFSFRGMFHLNFTK